MMVAQIDGSQWDAETWRASKPPRWKIVQLCCWPVSVISQKWFQGTVASNYLSGKSIAFVQIFP